ncbi:RagB/SusD family nutrient uptake outer membrane protein [Flavivirga rizhaonensis]|uniref:RagB/SusD family nutrient uptake outer membrane protein n=1 Tax=Flavivirga rizhaonensis TaxID=2559571 RepID=A0A4S1E2L7_9FLAO|nr:RagB/SusD family nutrient uptake outer membrane protein [Flavivirga rizhaonensis]TGV04877.1 RagB/SusD family nutrient uptake outer membrane protein [Flavivirga rizhaonensis]
MKNIIKIKILSIVAVCVCFTSCEITEPIDDQELQFQLDAETAINDESSVNLALAGAYASFKLGPENLTLVPNVLSGIGVPTSNPFLDLFELQSWQINQPLNSESSGSVTSAGMAGLYRVINDANWIIEKVSELGDGVFTTPGRREEVLGEAYGLRALAHFYLLRNWGQWYDESSIYGIALRLEPIRSGLALPRNNVADTYAQIHSDLDFAITNAPDLTEGFYMNKIAARATKAKVYLYQGNYPMAASTAKGLIDEAGGAFSLSPTFLEMFDNTSTDLFNNPELLFGLRGDMQAPLAFGGWDFSVAVNPAFINNVNAGTMTVGTQTINYDSDRVTSTTFNNFGNVFNLKRVDVFAFVPEENELVYFSRLSEVYLIYAEAEARSTNSVTTDALNALNAIRLRAGATTTGGDGFETYPATISLDQFLEAVRIEKMVEFAGEIGEEWFDLVRYDWIDGFGSGFQVSDFKASATDPNKFILPIPLSSIQAGGNVEIQNPSYE